MNNVANNGIITLHAGDSFSAPIFLNAGSAKTPIRYILKNDDALYFGVMEPGQPFQYALIRKKLTKADLNDYGDPVIKLRPEDTEHLMPGLYYYEVKVVKDDGGSDSDSDSEEGEQLVMTAISKTKLYIL